MPRPRLLATSAAREGNLRTKRLGRVEGSGEHHDGSPDLLRPLAGEPTVSSEKQDSSCGGKVALLDLDLEQLVAVCTELGLPAFRARQVWRWIYGRYTLDFEGMTDLPQVLRRDLASRAQLAPFVVQDERTSADGTTTKALFALADGRSVETVLMRYEAGEAGRGRRTVCVSTQVGCPIGCVFCATGAQGFERNLTAGEIVAQVLHYAALGEGEITNVVFMGQGEPFLNFSAVWQAIEVLNDPVGFDLGARHMTISTAGVVPGIRELAKKDLQVGLAVSLHAPNDGLRSRLVPLNRRYPLSTVIAACRDYAVYTGRRITFEYALIDRVNDEPSQAGHLAGLLRGLPCHVNLIPLNATQPGGWRPSPKSRVLAFQAELVARGVPTTLRVKRGEDILAACGQLRSRIREAKS